MLPKEPMYRDIPEPLTESFKMAYKDGYKYQLYETFVIKMGFSPEKTIETPYGVFTSDGWIIIWEGYAWDGASGPTYDSKNSMVGSCVHDFLYQLMRDGKLPYSFRKKADLAIYYLCRRDGMNYFRVKAWYIGVRVGAGKYAKPKAKKKVLYAP
jgi:hypothetical protein